MRRLPNRVQFLNETIGFFRLTKLKFVIFVSIFTLAALSFGYGVFWIASGGGLSTIIEGTTLYFGGFDTIVDTIVLYLLVTLFLPQVLLEKFHLILLGPLLLLLLPGYWYLLACLVATPLSIVWKRKKIVLGSKGHS